MRPFGSPETNSLRNVMAFTVLAHVLDLITTQWRDPMLHNEANPFVQLAVQHFGFMGWPSLVVTKVLVVGALGLAYWWYLGVRHQYLPAKAVRSPRSLIWNGMWDGKPYPTDLWGRLFNRRKLSFLGVILAGFALPGSGAAALFISLDNASVALNRAIPIQLSGYFLLATVGIVALWFYWAYWHYYKTQVRAGLIPLETPSP